MALLVKSSIFGLTHRQAVLAVLAHTDNGRGSTMEVIYSSCIDFCLPLGWV